MPLARTPGAVYFNDRDFSDLDVAIVRAPALLGVNTARPDLAATGGTVGQSLMSLDWNIEPRTLTVRVLLQASSHLVYRDRLEKLIYLLSTGTVEIRSAHDPDYLFVARWQGHTLPVFDPQFVTGPVAGEGDLVFTTLVPWPIERTAKAYAITVAGSAGRRRVPVGSGPALWELEVVAPGALVSNPTFTLYNDLGYKVGEMRWETTLAADDWLRADATRRRTWTTVSSVESKNESILRVGDRWFLIRPQYGDWESGSWCYAELTATAGSPVGYLKVRRTKTT